MDENNVTTKYSLEERRKVHARLGMKWDKEEDDKLKQQYEAFRNGGAADFEVFLLKLVKEFERAAGGIKARLAMHFDDVPGWDYERDKFRDEARNAEAEKAFTPELDEKLQKEYQIYKDAKHETYIKFLSRLADMHGWPEGRIISHRLRQLVEGDVVKYSRTDVGKKPRFEKTAKLREEEPVIDFDYSDNPEALEALRILNDTNTNIFLTGEAGTGKSALLTYFRQQAHKNVAVVAPTGVAAVNIGGQTIHSFCGFGPDITLSKVKKLAPWTPKSKLLRKIDMIVIDEISMVRADLLDCVDKFLRMNGPKSTLPFGGIQMVFIGDLYQLPPVEKDFVNTEGMFTKYKSPYFFESKALEQTPFTYIELKRVYRQLDSVFLSVLNAVRNNVIEEEHITILNERAKIEGEKFTFEQFAVYLTTTNHRARQVNNFFLQRLDTPLKTYQGKAAGTFEDRELPTDMILQVKVGSQIMMLTNDFRKRWVNGTMGKVLGFYADKEEVNAFETLDEPYYVAESSEYNSGGSEQGKLTDSVAIELETGETVYVKPYTWEMIKFSLDKHSDEINSETTGTFTQYPFKLAWAVTIHKSQGKTFNKVYVDLATGTFAHGQLYVALSRCRTLEGLRLRRPVTRDDIILDPRVSEFMSKLLEKNESSKI